METNRTPLIFIYLGGQLPDYAYSSLAMACENNDVQVHLVLEIPSNRVVDQRVIVHYTDEFYEKSEFENFKKLSLLDQEFLGGFWLHTAERLFVLQQYAQFLGFERFMHAELDIIFFDLTSLTKRIPSLLPAIYVPRDSLNRAMASLIIVTSHFALASLIEFFQYQNNDLNEMQILAQFIQNNPDLATSLPSDNALSQQVKPNDWSYLPESLSGGIFDCAALGQWLFGIDPKISSGFVRSGYVNDALSVDLQDYFFLLHDDRNQLVCIGPDSKVHNIYCLHVHSKIHTRLMRPGEIEKYINAANHGKKIIVTFNLLNVYRSRIGQLKHSIKQTKLYKFYESNLLK